MVKNKSNESNVCSQNQLNNLLISATAGTIIGATTALLLAPKSGRRLRNDLVRTYEDLSEKGQDLMDDVVGKGQKVADTASEYADNIRESASCLLGSTNNNSNSNLLLGAVSGGVLGLAAVLYLLRSKNQENFDGNIVNNINKAGKFAKKNSGQWIETAKDILETISSKANECMNLNGSSESEEDESEDSHSALHDVMNLASVGFKVWQTMKKRR